MRDNLENAMGNSAAEDLFINLFCEVFGPEKLSICMSSIRL